MSKVLSTVMGLVMGAVASTASAALVTLPFTIEVEAVSAVAEGVDVGSRFDGTVRYDDTDLTPDGGNFVVGSTLEIDFAFTRGSNFVSPELFIASATVSAGGELVDLDFSVDVPNDFFFNASNLVFNYEFSRLELDEEGNQVQVTIANGRGSFLQPVIEVPAPAPALLLLPVMAMLARRRR